MKKYIKADLYKDIPEDEWASSSTSSMDFSAKMINAVYSVVEEYVDIRSLNSEQKVILANSVDDIVEKLYSIIL